MQAKLISAAVAAMFVGAPAFAATPAFNVANTLEVYISGATAQHGQLENFMRLACQDTTLTKYRVDGNNFAYHCAVNTAVVPGLSKANIVVYKSGVGGSGNGTAPVANNSTTLTFMDIGTLNVSSTCGAATTTPAVGTTLIGFDTMTCTQPLVGKMTEIGLSDVEPALFKGSVAGLDDTALGKLTVAPTNQLIFGVPVTLGLYTALQTAQIANGSLPATCTAGNESEVCMPSLTKSQVTGIYTGSIYSWTQLGLANGTPDAFDNRNYTWVARRVQTSGTQTSARVFFLNDPCVANMVQFVEDPAGPLATTNAAACSSADPITDGYSLVFQGSGSSNVVSCLNAHQDNGRWAVGVLSTEYSTEAVSKFRFIKVDGAAPTLYQAANGNYQYVMEATMQYANASAATPLAGDDLVFAGALQAGFNNPTVISGLNAGFDQTYGHGGILGVPGANVPTDPIVAGDSTVTGSIFNHPVSAYTHSSAGPTNNCQPLQPTQAGSRTGAF